MTYQWHNADYSISTDRERLDRRVIHDFLAQHSYWARDREFVTTEQAIDNSLCFGMYYGSTQQIGFARIITDYATFAYLADLFVLPAHRKRGLGKWLVQCILNCPALSNISNWELRTADAHGLYARFGFSPTPNAENVMVLKKLPVVANAYPEFALATNS